MSRVGSAVVSVPAGVEVKTQPEEVQVKGTHGVLSVRIPEGISVAFDTARRELSVARADDRRELRALHGLIRSLVANVVRGVVQPWEKKLEIVGVGYQASLAPGKLTLNVGFANPVIIPIPKGVTCELPDNTHVVLKSADRQAVGQVAANVRSIRPPEPYKGKGIRYAGEYVKRKQGKAFGS
jgi:large subunit ribosomal protein L6